MITFNEIRLLVHLSSVLFPKTVGDWDSCFFFTKERKLELLILKFLENSIA